VSSWAARAKLHSLQKAHKGSDESDETPLLALMAPHFGALCEKRESANDPVIQAPDPPASDNLIDWHALDTVYMTHHFNCSTCIAAGRGSRYGQRCGAGMALWRAYCD
jgi:hypothetical protein